MSSNFKQNLLNLSEDFDEFFNTLQKSYSDEKLAGWVSTLLLAPFTKKNFWSLIKSLFPFILGVIINFGIFFLPETSIIIKIISGISTLFVALLLTYVLHFFKMINPKDTINFHIGAYRVAKKQEYELFVKYLPYNFSFNGLYDEVVTHNPSRQELLIKEQQIYLQKEQHEKYVKEAEKNFLELKNEFKDLQEQNLLVVELFKEIVTVFYQFLNNHFHIYSLKFFSGFTIYEVSNTKKNYLYKIADIGTSGHSPEIIDIPEVISETDFAVLRALKPRQDRYEPEFDIPYKNRFIVSLSMQMNNNNTWVFNFHADKDNTKALFFLLTDSIMETREVYRLIHSLCLNLEQRKGRRRCGKKLH
ncbi:hypothetical protein [Exiguobacterium aurantiacum]|uniref:hypothetical protein n=1 Tax=Exiguobacterium aurantiacum TaxID=33987 RepID=UPI000877A041|nr:hypothetical protein [Exiguobacterium aurantiacum]